jgi:Mg2+-importing ATPase
MTNKKEPYWSIPNESLFDTLRTSSDGLSSSDANKRFVEYGINSLDQKRKIGSLSIFLSQFKSPIILIFLATALLSLFLQAREDSLIIIAIVLISSFLGYWQEKGASDAIRKLTMLIYTEKMVRFKISPLRILCPVI